MAAGPFVWLALYLLGSTVQVGRVSVASYLLFVVIYPILEEWIFRGNLQVMLAKKLAAKSFAFSISFANLATSFLFAVLHLFSHPPIWAAAVIVPSLIFGFAMDRYKTLAAPVILHMFYNAGYFMLFA